MILTLAMTSPSSSIPSTVMMTTFMVASSLFLAANATRLRLEGKLRMILYITRDEVSIAKEKHNNTSLHQSRSHLVLTSACQ